jgi:hypothetical protein
MKKLVMCFSFLGFIFANCAFASVTLTNNSSYNLNQTYTHQYQMDDWNFPDSIQNHSVANANIFFNYGIGYFPFSFNEEDDGAEVIYTTTCKDGSVENILIHADFKNSKEKMKITTSGGNCVIVSPTDFTTQNMVINALITFGDNS